VPEANASENETGHGPAQSTGEIDVEKLAERVYQLMIREVRLDLARTGRALNRREA